MDISLVRLRFGKNLELLRRTDEMRSLVEKTINVVRHVASNLRPAILDHGLIPALDWLSADFAKRWPIRCVFEADSSEIVLDETQSTAIFRVVQESLTNVARHARASQVDISLRQYGQQLEVTVKDNGHGFDKDAISKTGGFGMFSIRERMLALGGTLDIDSAPKKGTAVTIRLALGNPS